MPTFDLTPEYVQTYALVNSTCIWDSQPLEKIGLNDMDSLASQAKAAREALVLDAAAFEFNRAGVAGANLVQIAGRVGLTRAGLYNYVADRQDLATKAYLRACRLTAVDLDRSQLSATDGVGQLLAFLRLALALDRAPLAALADLGALSAPQQKAVRQARQANIDALSSILERGVEEGSLRPVNLELACQAILGVLSWAPMARAWVADESDGLAIRMAAAIPDLLLSGLSSTSTPDRRGEPMVLHDAVPRYAEIDLNRGLIVAEGSTLFNQRGVDGVSLDDVAAAVGATKGIVYHRHKSKPAFVAECFDRAFAFYDAIMDVAEAEETGLAASRVCLELNIQAQLSPSPPLSLAVGFDILPKADQQRFTARTQRLRLRAAELGRRGARDGSLRAHDLEPVSLASAGVFSYLAKWPLKVKVPPHEIAREAADMLLFGLQRLNEQRPEVRS